MFAVRRTAWRQQTGQFCPIHSPSRRPPSASDPATRRAQLLDAADACSPIHGVNAPLELVVQHAGVGRATLYRQFPDRHAILLALL
ncbi:MAG: helix-turn-helix domain-containing protein [Burkholderiaceae bacterium]